jgi:putative membrane protein
MRLLVRWLINAAALLVAAWFVPGIRLGAAAGSTPSAADWKTLLVVALIFGIVNIVIRPFVSLLSLPLTILTLGLFIFVINALMLLLTSYIAQRLDLNFRVDGFVPAFVGALVVSIVSFLLNRTLVRP